MKVNAAPRPPGFRHALVHADDPVELLAAVVPAARAAARDTGARVALDLPTPLEEALHDELGDEVELGRLTSLTSSARESGQTVAAWRARELRALTSSGRPVLVVGAHDPDLDGVDGGFWVELEAALNISLAGLPVLQVCAYPRLPLHGAVGESAEVNHPLRLHASGLAANPRYRPPAEAVAALPIAPPHLLGPPDVTLSYNTFELSRVRDAVTEAARACRFDTTRGEDMVQAVNEIATNAVEHGSPQAELSVWARDGELVCEVQDSGVIALPLIGLAPLHPSQARDLDRPAALRQPARVAGTGRHPRPAALPGLRQISRSTPTRISHRGHCWAILASDDTTRRRRPPSVSVRFRRARSAIRGLPPGAPRLRAEPTAGRTPRPIRGNGHVRRRSLSIQ